MALMTKVDLFGIADTAVVVSDTSDNAQIQSAEAQGEDGFVVAVDSFGERTVPTVNYEIVNTMTSKSIELGGALTATGVTGKIVPVSVSVSTSAGGVPTMTISGNEVPAASVLTGGCKCTVSLASISPLHHAQFCGTGITMSGTGAHLISSTWTAETQISLAEVDGVIKAYDITGGKQSFTGTIQVSSATTTYTKPTVTLPTGWVFTAPLSCTNPNADFPTWTFTAEKAMAADTSNSSSL